MFAVGVGPAVDSNQLRSISGIRQPDGTSRRAQDVSWFRTPNFQQIDELVNAIVEQVCNIPPPPPTGKFSFITLKFCQTFWQDSTNGVNVRAIPVKNLSGGMGKFLRV